MSRKSDMAVRHKADSVESALKAYGICRVPNDEPGFCFAVGEELVRRFPNSDLKIESPPRNFGGEYTFSSENRLKVRDDQGP